MERSVQECECKAQSTSESKVSGFSFYKKSFKAETNGSKMMKFGANVTQTALKGLNLAQTGNYDHVLNLKYTCRALPSCFILFWEKKRLAIELLMPLISGLLLFSGACIASFIWIIRGRRTIEALETIAALRGVATY